MDVLVDGLESLGWRWAYRLVDARAFGLPQRRQRVILVASRRHDPRTVLFADARRRMTSRTNPDCSPSMPAVRPAWERSVQGNPAETASQRGNERIVRMSGRIGTSGNLSESTALAGPQISQRATGSIPAPRNPRSKPPMPANRLTDDVRACSFRFILRAPRSHDGYPGTSVPRRATTAASPVGIRLRALREAAGLSQEALARASGVSATVISRIERGAIAEPSLRTLRALARTLSTSLDELAREGDDGAETRPVVRRRSGHR